MTLQGPAATLRDWSTIRTWWLVIGSPFIFIITSTYPVDDLFDEKAAMEVLLNLPPPPSHVKSGAAASCGGVT